MDLKSEVLRQIRRINQVIFFSSENILALGEMRVNVHKCNSDTTQKEQTTYHSWNLKSHVSGVSGEEGVWQGVASASAYFENVIEILDSLDLLTPSPSQNMGF
jgi:hypothetical protein